jgi:hypothetical protein
MINIKDVANGSIRLNVFLMVSPLALTEITFFFKLNIFSSSGVHKKMIEASFPNTVLGNTWLRFTQKKKNTKKKHTHTTD